MSERTTNTLLGAFVMGGIVIVVALVISIAGSGLSRDAQKVRMVFDGSITGLNVGAPVALRGVEIGQVTDIRVRVDDVAGLNLVMEVDADVDASRIQQDQQAIQGIDASLIAAGLRAQLDTQSLLTGLLYVQLDFHPETEVTLRCLTDERFEIPTIPSPLDQFFSQLEELHLPDMAANLESIMASLQRITADAQFQQLPARAVAVLDSAEQTLQAVDVTVKTLGPQLTETLAATRTAVDNINTATPGVLEQLEQNLVQMETTLASVANTSDQMGAVLDHDSPLLLTLTTTLREIERTSRALNTLARTIEEQPQALILGKSQPEENP